MGRVLQSPSGAKLAGKKRSIAKAAAPQPASALVPPVDLAAPVVYFPVRHHSPACAYHVRKLIEQLKPQVVLIEGPRDATRLIPLLLDKDTRLPVAVYTTFVERVTDDLPRRHAAYYPLCAYSPELVALQAAAAIGAQARFIDLTFPEMVVAGSAQEDQEASAGRAQSLFDERRLSHSRLLREVCARTGTRDPDELWDHLYEVDYHERPTDAFMQAVLTYCALARQDQTSDMLEADGTLARERAMAAAIVACKGRKTLVVTGGFHSVALPTTAPAMPAKVEAAEQDALVVLMRYGFEQLDRLNGYASGMPSPGFYQRAWDGEHVSRVFVELGRRCRDKGQEISVADEIAALDHCQRIAQLRGHLRPAREDLLDAVRACLIKGSAGIEGVMVLGLARQLLAGDAVGAVPANAGQPPIVADFRASADRLHIDLDQIMAKECILDLYRKTQHREASRFFYRLRFLDVPFGELLRGPDFVAGRDLERIQEVWKYHWSPAVESALIERSLYGASVEEASAAMLLERFAQAETQGQGRRADVAAGLLLEACRMGLHRHTPELMKRTGTLVAADPDFTSLVGAMETLLVLHVSREPLEAHALGDVAGVAGQAYDRAMYLLPQLIATPEEQTQEILTSLNMLSQAVQTLGDTPARQDLRHQRMAELAATVGGNAAIRGAAVGTLYADGQLSPADTVRQLRGHLGGAVATDGPAFLRGLLTTARSILWQLPEAVDAIHEVLRSWPEDLFVRQIPYLRLAMSDLTPRECDAVAKAVADRFGLAGLKPLTSTQFAETDMLLAVNIQRRLMQVLAADGLAALAEAPA